MRDEVEDNQEPESRCRFVRSRAQTSSFDCVLVVLQGRTVRVRVPLPAGPPGEPLPPSSADMEVDSWVGGVCRRAAAAA